MDGVVGYSSSTSAPFARNYVQQRSETANVPTRQSRSSVQTTRVRYDLGLGKNPPVGMVKHEDTSTSTTTTNANVQEAMQYLVEHDSVNPYPSPQHRQDTVQSSCRTELDKRQEEPQRPSEHSKRRKQNTLYPSLYSSFASSSSLQSNQAPSTTTSSSSSCRSNTWNLNTKWVDLLIQEQQQKEQRQLVPRRDNNTAHHQLSPAFVGTHK